MTLECEIVVLIEHFTTYCMYIDMAPHKLNNDIDWFQADALDETANP